MTRHGLVATLILVVATTLVDAQPADNTGRLESARGAQMMAERALAVGEYKRGMVFAETALKEREAALGPDDPLIADSALVLGIMRGKNGDRKTAEQLLGRALAIREKATPKDGAPVAQALVAYAALLRQVGVFVRAEPMLVRAVAIEEKSPGADRSPGLARALDELALLLAEKDDPRCEGMFRRAIGIFEKAGGADSGDVAQPLKDLGDLLARRGDFARAVPLYERAMAILEAPGDLGDPRRAAALRDFARVQLANGKPQAAITLGGLAYTIDSRILGADHPFVARDLMQLAELSRATGDPTRSERYLWQAQTISERALGPNHPDVGHALAELAAAYAARNDTKNAIALLERALRIFRASLGPNHPSVATTLISLSKLALVQPNLPRALALATEAGEIRESSLELLLYAGSERQKRLYLATLAEETDATLSLHIQFAPTDVKASRLALVTLLRRKGRVLDTMTDTLGTLRGRATAADAAVFDKLAAIRSRLAQLVLQGPDSALGGASDVYTKELAALSDDAQKLEAELSTKSAAFRADRARVTLEAVQAAIPAGTMLVEIASYQPLEIKERTGRRYVAYVLGHTGDPTWVDLGPQAPIDELVKQVRVAFASSERTDAVTLARQLDAKVMAPVRKLLGASTQLLLSPDGALNLVPFAAFVDEQQQFLIERYTIDYLTTGRDLLRLGAAGTTSSAGVIVMADPDFGAATAAATSVQRRSSDLDGVVFPPLPGTKDEGDALAKLLGKPQLFTGAGATEGQIKRARAPIVLHVATHGFFFEDRAIAGTARSRALVVVKGDPMTPPSTRIENPLLRSGLAFAGANQRTSGDDDGVLTALEATGLDLSGTQLVVLSACETGVGEVRNGDGVYGLRRALVMAGSESQVISLWKVDDLATRDLMIHYYDKLTGGAGRAAGLRAAQLAMLADKNHRHPYFWASFIPSGDWRPLRESFVRSSGRGPRGCGGCGSAGSGTLGIAMVAVMGLLLRRRRRCGAAVLVLALFLLLGERQAAADYVVTLPASKLDIQLAGSPTDWTVSDGTTGGRKWDVFQRASPDLVVRLQSVVGPTNCLLTLNLKSLEAMKGTRVVTKPGYLPPELYPDTLELATPTGMIAMACADLPDGAVTAIIFYKGKDWARDAGVVTPVLRAYAAAAAWGPGTRIATDRDVKLPHTELAIRLPGGWKELPQPNTDLVARMHVGKPALGIGVSTDVVRPMASVNGKLVRAKYPKGAADDCKFWAEGQRISPSADIQLVPRPAFVPKSWHAEAKVILTPRRDQLVLCLDTVDGRWLATIEFYGAWSDPSVAEAAAILQSIAANP